MNFQPFDQDDVIFLFLEYDRLFNEGKVTPSQVVAMLQFPPVQFGLNEAIKTMVKRISIKRQLEWADIYKQDGSFVARYWMYEPKWD